MPLANLSPQYQLDWEIAQASQNVTGNTSRVYGRLILRKLSGSGFWSNIAQNWSVNINGQTFSGQFTYDFRGYSELWLWQGHVNVTHNADGTKTIDSSASATMNSPQGSASISRRLTLSTIPRASTATFSGGSTFDAGTAVTINTNRASSSFTHDISWTFGSQKGTVSTGTGSSTSWTPPLSMLTVIPEAVQGSGHITVVTKSGSTVIGTKTTAFTLRAPASVTPTISSVNGADGNPTVKSLVGKYVQGLSLLTATVSAAGAYGSTIKSTTLNLDGKTVEAGEMLPLDVAGNRVLTATVVDSRGRVKTATVTVTVLPYNPPQAKWTVQRAASNGTPNDNGTYLRIDLDAAARSVVNGTERNGLKITVATRQVGQTAWTARNTITQSALTYKNNFLVSGGGIFAVTTAYEVRLTVADNLMPTPMSGIDTVSTSEIVMDFDGKNGVGVGRYRQRGRLDVEGDTYTSGQLQADGDVIARGGALVAPVGGVFLWLTNSLPAGALLCNGAAVSRTTYAALFAVIGTTYGTGNGSTTFNLPDFRGRVPVGYDVSQTEFNALNKAGGDKTHTLTEAEMPSHSHDFTYAGKSYGTWPLLQNVGSPHASVGFGAGAAFSPTRPVGINNAGGGSPHNNLQPYRTAHFVIQAL